MKGKVTIFNKINVREALIPIKFEDLPERENEKQRAMETLTFSVKMTDNKVKARTCAKGGIQRKYISKEEASSPTGLTEIYICDKRCSFKGGKRYDDCQYYNL